MTEGHWQLVAVLLAGFAWLLFAAHVRRFWRALNERVPVEKMMDTMSGGSDEK